jgi:O-antigen/teichoic acid export membrane protein
MTGLVAAVTATAVRAARDASSVLLVCQLVAGGVAFAVNIFAARALAPAGRGELALLLQIAYLSSLGLLLGCDRSLVAVYAGHSVRTVSRACLRLLRLPSLLGFAVVVVLFTVPGVGDWRTGLALAVLFAVVNAFVRGVRSIAIATGHHRGFYGYTLASQALLILEIALLFLLHVDNTTTWMLAYLLAGAMPTAVWLVLWTRWSGPTAAQPTGGDGLAGDIAGRLRLARREGLQLFPAAVANSGMLRLDRLLLPAMASTAALGIYASVATMTELIAWPLLALSDSRLGVWRAAHERGSLTLHRFLLLAIAYAIVSATIGGILIHILLVPLLGPGYAGAEKLIAPLVLAAATLGVSQLLISALTAVHHNLLASGVEIVGFAVSGVAYILLIPRFGALGAAYGSVLGYASCLLVAGVILFNARFDPHSQRPHRAGDTDV